MTPSAETGLSGDGGSGDTTRRFVIADVFASTPFGGNQLAVFPDARGLSMRAMQALAREFNFAESSFVFPGSRPGACFAVRIFTPRAEVPFAGHPTIGTAIVLAHIGTIPSTGKVVLEEGIGPVAVDVRVTGHGGTSSFSLERPVETPGQEVGREIVARVLGLPCDAVLGTWFASVGLPFCFVHLASAGAVDRATLDRGAWQATLSSAWSPHLFSFSGEVAPGAMLYARMFAPAFGIDEDPATGSAAVALAAVLANRHADADGSYDWRIMQGVAMGRPSVMDVTARKRKGVVESVRLSGSTLIAAEGEMRVPHGY